MPAIPIPFPIRTSLVCSGLALTLLGGVAHAEPVAFRIRGASTPEALQVFAAQAGVSVSWASAGICGGARPSLVGRFEPEEGLRRLLNGTGCGFRKVDDRAFEVLPASPSATTRMDPGPKNLEPVVIFATRRVTDPARLAFPISTVEAEEIRSQGVRDLGDLSAFVPGVIVTNLGPGRDKVLLRGLSDGPLTGRTQAMVGLYLDGVRLTYNAPDPDLRLDDISRVEVVRGPQGALFGSGSLGGVAYVVSARPDPQREVRELTAAVSATQGGSPSDLISGVWNLPLDSGQAALRVLGYRERAGGWLDSSFAGRNTNSTVRQGLRAAYLRDLPSGWRLTAGLIGQSIATRDAQYVSVASLTERPSRLLEPHDSDFLSGRLSLLKQFGGVELNLTTAVVAHRLTSDYDASGAALAAGIPGPVAYRDDNQITSWVNEMTLRSPGTAPEPWIAGLFLAVSQQDTRPDLVPPGTPGAPLWGERREDRLAESAFFGELTRRLAEVLSFTVGGRISYARTDVRSRSLAGEHTIAVFDGATSRWRLAPKIEIVWRPTPRWEAYALISEGHRAGGFNTTGPPGQVFSEPSGALPKRAFQADELWNAEVGLRTRLLDDKLAVAIAVFDVRWSRIQSDQLLPSGLPYVATIGNGQNLGLEADLRFTSDPFRAGLSALVNNPEITHSDAAFPARAELGLAGVPDATVSAWASTTWPLERSAVDFDVRVAYLGHSRLTFDRAVAPEMGGYFDTRASLTWRNSEWRLSASLENLGDGSGNTFAYGNPFTIADHPQATPQRPLTATLRVVRRF